LTALVVSVLHRRIPTTAQALLLVSAFVGLGLALGVRFQVMAPIGLLLAVTAASGVAVNMIVSGVALRGLDLSVFSLHMAVAALVCALIAIIAADAFALPGGDPRGWQVLGLSLLAFLVAFVALYAGLPLIGAERLSMVMNLEPIATILIALLLLDESLTTQQMLGGGIVLVAVVMAQFTGQGRRSR
jgi:drug/metabolite transporter (DMT)-like permease